MKIHILRIIIVYALLEAPFVFGGIVNREQKDPNFIGKAGLPSYLSDGIKGFANIDSMRGLSTHGSDMSIHLRGAGFHVGNDRQLQVDNIFRTNFGCDTFCNKPRNNCGNRCNAQIASCESRGVACHPWLCTAFCRGDRSTTYCQDRQLSSSECNRYRKRCGCRDYRTTGRYKPVTGLAAVYDSSTDEVILTWDKQKGPKHYQILVSQDGQKLEKVSARGRKKGLAASPTFVPNQSYEIAVKRKKTKTMDSSPYTVIEYKHITAVDPAQQHRAYNDLVSTTEDYTGDVTGNVLLNDFDPDFGHTLTVDVSRVSGPPGSTIVLSGDGGSVIITLTNGSTLSLRSDGSYAFRRAPGSYQEFSGAQTDFETFTYAFNDGHGNSAEADLVIGIQGANDAPIAVSDLFYHRSPGGSAPLGDVAEGCVLENDADIDHGDEASLAVCVVGGSELQRSSYHQVVDLGDNIKLVIAVDGCFSMLGLSSKYAKLQNGTTADECFFYRACDGHHADSSNYMSNVAEACVRVEGAFVNACVPNPCEHGTCSASSTNAGSYTCSCDSGWEVPEGGAICSLDINECVVTPNGGCDPLTNCTNTAGGYVCGLCPQGYSGTGETKCIDESQIHTAQDDTLPTNEDQIGALTGNVLDNDFDPEFGHTLKVDLHQVTEPPGSTVTYSGDGLSMMIKLPNGSTLSLSTTGNYTFRRASGAYQELSGTQDEYEQFKYVVDDNHGNTAEATLYVRIQGANDAPIVLNDLFVHSSNDPTSIEDVADGCVLENDKDIDIGDVASLAVCVVNGVEIHNDNHQHVDLSLHTKLSIAADGCFTVSGLATEYQYLTKGEIADLCFFYQACDRFGYKSNVAEACVRVEGVYDVGDPDGDPLGDPHEINGGRAFDEDGNFLANIFQGDVLVTFSQVADMFGVQFAIELKSSGFIFSPEESGFDQESRAMSITHRPRNRWPEDNRAKNVPSEFKYRGYAGKILVPYDFSSNIDIQKRRIIIEAMRELERSEVLRFINATELDELADVEGEESTIRNHFIRFIRQDDVPNEDPDKPPCGWSYVGFSTKKDCQCGVRLGCTCQTISLGYSFGPRQCGYSISTIQHEILHALGFWHEHSRSDRKEYVKVNYENIIGGEHHNFKFQAASISLGTPYDYGSIMHYHRNAFRTDAAKNASLHSMDIIKDTEPFQANPRLIGQRYGLSNTDFLQLRLLYLCSTGAKDVGDFTKCSKECPCWENAPYQCENNDECQAGLTCVLRPYELKGRQEPYCTDLPANTKGCEIQPPSQPEKICFQIKTGECLYSDPNTYPGCYGQNPEKPICSTSNKCIPCFEWSNDATENDSKCSAIVGNKECDAQTGACTGDVSCINNSDCSLESTCSNGICIKTGNPRFSLHWAGEEANDLDLYVITPGGFELSYQNDYDPITNGRLDKDFIPYDEEHDGKDGPWIENIYFPVGEAPDGSYEVFVHNEGVYDDTVPLDPFTFEIWEDPADSPLFSYSGEGLAEDSDSPHFVYTKPDSLVVGIILPCNPNPCKHGGTCSESSTAASGYVCSCDSGWKGADCDEDINECTFVANGGCDPLTSCTNTNGGYSCSACPSGYSGDGKNGCTEIPKPCTLNPCKHGGTCSESSAAASGYTCSCDSGWEGTNCDEDINECATNNGGCDPLTSCTNTNGGYSCSACPSGYSGDGKTGCTQAGDFSITVQTKYLPRNGQSIVKPRFTVYSRDISAEPNQYSFLLPGQLPLKDDPPRTFAVNIPTGFDVSTRRLKVESEYGWLAGDIHINGVQMNLDAPCPGECDQSSPAILIGGESTWYHQGYAKFPTWCLYDDQKPGIMTTDSGDVVNGAQDIDYCKALSGPEVGVYKYKGDPLWIEQCAGGHYYVLSEYSSNYWNLIGTIDLRDSDWNLVSAQCTKRTACISLGVLTELASVDIGIENEGRGWFPFYYSGKKGEWDIGSWNEGYGKKTVPDELVETVTFSIDAKINEGESKDSLIGHFTFHGLGGRELDYQMLEFSLPKGDLSPRDSNGNPRLRFTRFMSLLPFASDGEVPAKDAADWSYMRNIKFTGLQLYHRQQGYQVWNMERIDRAWSAQTANIENLQISQDGTGSDTFSVWHTHDYYNAPP